MSLQSLVEQCIEGDPIALAQEQAVQWQGWLQPLSSEAPTGEDPGYDDDFQQMREEVNKLSGADAERVVVLAEKLFTRRSKDLRVAGYYLWARVQLQGEAGLAAGLNLLAAMLTRYPVQVWPQRPNSRRQALQWLTSAKVLDSLALHPELVKAEAERTVAALMWLQQALQAWPEEQRPVLDALYGALSARLVQSGGVQTLVPQHSAGREPAAHPSAPATAVIRCGRDLLDNGRVLAAYLREQPQGWLAAHRLFKHLRWDTVHQAPPLDAKGNTRLAPPRGDARAQLKRLHLHLQQNWRELLEQAERQFAEGVNHFCLDLQWYLCQALVRLPDPHSQWADIVRHDLAMLLQRMPGLEVLCWNDGTPFADDTTREWISREVCGQKAQAWPQACVMPVGGAEDILALEGEALAQADSQGVEVALAWLAARPGLSDGRQRWLLRLLMARVAEQYGKSELAIHLLGELQEHTRSLSLAAWEPDLAFENLARLLRLLRLKAQRSEADKPALAQRMEQLLAALVAIDPVKAAVLCA